MNTRCIDRFIRKTIVIFYVTSNHFHSALSRCIRSVLPILLSLLLSLPGSKEKFLSNNSGLFPSAVNLVVKQNALQHIRLIRRKWPFCYIYVNCTLFCDQYLLWPELLMVSGKLDPVSKY